MAQATNIATFRAVDARDEDFDALLDALNAGMDETCAEPNQGDLDEAFQAIGDAARLIRCGEADVALCGGSGEGRAVSRATRRGWQADPCGKTHDTVGIGRVLERKEDKIHR